MIPPLDTLCLWASLAALSRRQVREEGLNDVLETLGYSRIGPETEASRAQARQRGWGLYRALRLMQDRRHIVPPAELVAGRNPRTIVDIETGHGGPSASGAGSSTG